MFNLDENKSQTMKNYFKTSLLVAIAVSFLTLTSCIEDAIKDATGLFDEIPNSYRGTWVDGNSNEITVGAQAIVFEGNSYTFDGALLITSNGVDVYTVNSTFDGTDQNFYLKQPGSTDELQMSTFTLTQDFITYTKP